MIVVALAAALFVIGGPAGAQERGRSQEREGGPGREHAMERERPGRDLEMQRKHHDGEKYIKKRYYEDLASRFGRTDKSFEYRMQNISYVMTLLGRTWLPGLKSLRKNWLRLRVFPPES